MEVGVSLEEALEVAAVVEEDGVGVFGFARAFGPFCGCGGGRRLGWGVGGVVGFVGFGAGD